MHGVIRMSKNYLEYLAIDYILARNLEAEDICNFIDTLNVLL
jgi:hypothetical protein